MADSLDKIRNSKNSAGRVTKPGGKKVDRGFSPGDAQGAEDAGFNEVLRSVTGTPGEQQLSIIFGDIRSLSERLSKKRLLEDLEVYRDKISQFLRIYMDEVLDVRAAKGGGGAYRKKQLLVIKRVNVELEELSRLVLGGAPDFRVLNELGTIEGLLMDLYK